LLQLTLSSIVFAGDPIKRAMVCNKNILVYLCENCFAMWDSENIRKESAKKFTEYMQNLGLSGDLSELTQPVLLCKHQDKRL
jgi:hypothetical protein